LILVTNVHSLAPDLPQQDGAKDPPVQHTTATAATATAAIIIVVTIAKTTLQHHIWCGKGWQLAAVPPLPPPLPPLSCCGDKAPLQAWSTSHSGRSTALRVLGRCQAALALQEPAAPNSTTEKGCAVHTWLQTVSTAPAPARATATATVAATRAGQARQMAGALPPTLQTGSGLHRPAVGELRGPRLLENRSIPATAVAGW